ncbi:hypothetical protein [uncultured Dysosmobacter sp.]|nr:hypothetical protein [uncultured Dysosmobacter sp.]
MTAITHKTIKLFYWDRMSGPGGEAACGDVGHSFSARRNKKLF